MQHTTDVFNDNQLSLKLDAYRLVFVNGLFSSELSDKNIGAWKIQIDTGIKRLALSNPINSEIFLYLTESLAKETIRIYLPINSIEKRPLYLLYASQGNNNNKQLNMMHYCCHLEIGNHARGKVIEHFVHCDTFPYFNGIRTVKVIHNHAYLDYTKLTSENSTSYHVSHNDIFIGYHSIVKNNILDMNAYYIINRNSMKLNGSQSQLTINSLLLPSIQKKYSIYTYLEHNNNHCISRQLHKIIIQKQGIGVFHGLIKVNRCALKTDGHMVNNNLLLDDLSSVDIQPQLEIYADDVKCSHGATVGQISKEQIFYLNSRGINCQDAKYMVIYAFAKEIIDSVNCYAVQNKIILYIDSILSGKII